jgi:hypothetical protein
MGHCHSEHRPKHERHCEPHHCQKQGTKPLEIKIIRNKISEKTEYDGKIF